MKSKGEEKLMGPMFPRLHVNDKEKGGPRAPPRNKMALYEQLSIPSQRFKHGISSNPKNANCQGNGLERDAFFSVQLPPSTHPAEKPHSCSSNSKTSLLPVESNNKTEEDDFRVPVFINSKVGQGNGKFYSTLDSRKLSASTAVLLGHSRKDLNEENSKQLSVSREHSCNSVRVVDNGDSSLLMNNVASKEQMIPDNNHINDTKSKEDKASESLQTRIVDQGDDLSETSMVESISGMYISPDDVVGIIGQKHFWNARRAISNQQRAFAVQVFELHRLIKVQKLIAGSQSMPDDITYLGKPVKGSSAKRLPLDYIIRDGHNVSKQRNDSEKPNIRMECSAENTVGKPVKDSSAKKLPLEYIVRDGHNILKQRKDSENPNTKMECSAENTVGKPANDSSARRLPSEYIVSDSRNMSKQRNDSEKPNVRMECSAENTVGKISFSSVQNSPFLGHPVTIDSTMGPWSFNQPSSHQWLIPVMSPSEGLVYKPYPGPGVTSSACGGYGPPGSYGVPASHHQYQGVGMPFAAPAGPAYFPQYGMPAVDESNQFAAHGQLSGGGASFYVQRQTSSNVPSIRNGTASTASSPSGTTNRTVVDNATKGRNVLPLFPTSPATENPDSSPQPRVASHPARVIKVVPRNAMSATESAARIFQSIQEERKQYDSGFTHL
ncbi:protein EARLY FLOWERING 3 [Lycium ferocissimum]|uniref:protein EARLY FLOWERING 3 n=1 Tax=Lycium ferocissimum TaxID=112874 RepID=UPI002815E942|nr:protein EARLY FLOWERING 3 [Lycium ferocissimum]